MQAVEGRHAIGPLLGNRQAINPSDGIASSTRVVGAYLEARGKHNAIDLILLTVGNHSSLGEGLDTLAVRIHKRHVRVVEGLQILVMETGSLTELSVVRLERFSRLRVINDRIGPRSDLLHLGEICHLHLFLKTHFDHGFVGEVLLDAALFARTGKRPAQTPQQETPATGSVLTQLTKNVSKRFGPTIAHQILFDRHTRQK